MKKRHIYLICLTALTGMMYFICSHFPYFTETYYAKTVNKYWIQGLSHITGIFPFSLFEMSIYLLIGGIVFYLVYQLIQLFKKHLPFLKWLKKRLIHMFYLGFTLVMVFLWFWGFNYQRVSLSTLLDLPDQYYTSSALGALDSL